MWTVHYEYCLLKSLLSFSDLDENLPGIKVNISNLEDFLIRDATSKIEDSGK